MARPVSTKVLSILDELRSRLKYGQLPAGSPFFSNRSLAMNFGVSYQTAHRILGELADEGLIVREHGSGTITSGEICPLTRVALLFHPRAFVPGTWSNHLRTRLEAELRQRKIQFRYIDTEESHDIQLQEYPVFWDPAHPVPAGIFRLNRFCLILNLRPRLGLISRWIDSVSLDNHVGGMIAGEMLRDRYGCRKVAVIGGPTMDSRSNDRIKGFLDVFPSAVVLHAGTWGRPIRKVLFQEVAALEADGIFCINDRIAGRIKNECHWEGRAPAIVGFDNAPTAFENNLSTVGIPWDLFVESSVETIQKRLMGSRNPAIYKVLSLEPIYRGLE